MNADVNRALMHTEEVIRRSRKVIELYAQVERELSVAQDQLIAVDHHAARWGVRR